MPVMPIVFPKQPVLGGVGGNPWFLIQVMDGDGNALSEEMLIGRCNKLWSRPLGPSTAVSKSPTGRKMRRCHPGGGLPVFPRSRANLA